LHGAFIFVDNFFYIKKLDFLKTDKERENMIFKVFYQESKAEVPVRECTKSLYMEADSERDVRLKLKDQFYNIEFIQKLEGSFLDYEKNNSSFELVN
jgi:DNA-dependent RNA polymerase auxiliary subunit epsilon